MSASGPRPIDALAVVETLIPLLPRGWTEAEVELEGVDDLRVKAVSTRLHAGSTSPLPDMGLNMGHWYGAATMAFRRLLETIEAAGAKWDATRAECTKTDLEAGRLVLRDADGSVACLVEIPPEMMGAQILNDELGRIVEQGLPQWAARQERFVASLAGTTGWRFERPASLVFDRLDAPPRALRAQLLGSHSSDEFSWCWAWANRSYEPAVTAGLDALRENARSALGAGALWRPGWFCDAAFARVISMLAAEQIGADAVYIARISPSLLTYFAVFADPS